MERARSAMARVDTMKTGNVMHKPVDEVDGTILVVSDNVSDANLVKNLLVPEFNHVFFSINPDLSVEDFEKCAPDVLVLAFNTLEKSERYYLRLYRLSGKIHLQPHRTVILCTKDEVNKAYQACKKQYFDDYALFWPMTNDASRLLMSVHHALRDLAGIKDRGPSTAEFSPQVRRLGELERMLGQQIADGSERIEVVNRAIEEAEHGVGTALDGFSRKLTLGELPDVAKIENTAGLEREIKRLKQGEISQRFRTAVESVPPIKQWIDELRDECAPYIESVHTLKTMVDSIRPTILVVDDDAFQCKVVSRLLVAANYHLVFASGGVEALNILRKMQPDLILMDIMMPDLDGVETTRRLKTMPQFAKVPVIMVTGNSEGATVRDSMKAGAINFVVKPFDRDTLLAKIIHALGT
jgi:CheY-like chemotaxis protein